MANYENYKAFGKTLSEIFEDSDNRSNTSTAFSGYYTGTYNVRSSMSFASYISAYHPFRIDTRINYYYQNSNNQLNKGLAHKGGAPILREQASDSDHGATIIYKFLGAVDDSGLTTGMLKKEKTVGQTTTTNTYTCPSSVIFAVIGAGGGGAGGGGWWTGKRSYGGGCGPILIFNLEMPYKITNGSVDVLKIELGSGGNGGKAWSTGSKGGQTKIYFKKNNTWVLVATLEGGEGGINIGNGNIAFSPTTDMAITRVTFNNDYNISKSVVSNGDGYGKITVNDSCRAFSWGAGTYPYIPGNYYAPGMDDSYDQIDKSGPKITSSTSYDLTYLHPIKSWTTGYQETGSLFATNRQYLGKNSRFAKGGNPGGVGKAGGAGSWGSGGGGGGQATTGFDTGISPGGRGGAAGVRIYW